jgi:hypothetical protein
MFTLGYTISSLNEKLPFFRGSGFFVGAMCSTNLLFINFGIINIFEWL